MPSGKRPGGLLESCQKPGGAGWIESQPPHGSLCMLSVRRRIARVCHQTLDPPPKPPDTSQPLTADER